MLLRERATVSTQDSSDPAININPEFVFKGKGTRTKLVLDGNVKYQWSLSGFYREKNTLKTISNLPDRFNPFTQKDFAIYVLDDYAVHITQEIRKACCQRGYVLVVMAGGISDFIKANGTHLHRHLREREIQKQRNRVDDQEIRSGQSPFSYSRGYVSNVARLMERKRSPLFVNIQKAVCNKQV